MLLAIAGTAHAQRAADVDAEDVANAIHKAVAYLKTAEPIGFANVHAEGNIALKVLALINAGVPLDDPAVVAGLKEVAAIPVGQTYTTGLKIQALAAADPVKYRPQIAEAAEWLVSAQLPTGMWTYRKMNAGGDNSNTQFALMGLHEAAKAGVPIPPGTWKAAREHYERSQLADGGWGYNFTNGKGMGGSYGSMTAAGLASLYICGQQMDVSPGRAFANGVYGNCGRYLQNKAIAQGMEWMTKHFTVRQNPGRRDSYLYYYLYAMERVGMVSGLRQFGPYDWYRHGAAFLVSQQNADGSWNGQLYDNSFCLLFLAKGNRPVLIQKVAWNQASGRPGQWNRNIHDLENLTGYLGRNLGQAVTWQTTRLDVPLEELRQSPILFISGHEFPNVTPAEREKLQRFVDTGGTLLLDACCGSQAFTAGCRQFCKQAWPDYALRPLSADHQVYHSLKDIDAETIAAYKLEGIDVGCRTSVLFSPTALSCLWELRSVPTWSPRALDIGANIAAYATAREPLPGRLDKIVLPAANRPAEQLRDVPRGAVRIARLRHSGDYSADARALMNLAAMLRDEAGVDVVAKETHIDATDPTIYEYPVLFITGHHECALSNEEIDALRKYLMHGGVLVADACCGQASFDKSFRRTMEAVLPDHPLNPLPGDHPLYGSAMGKPLGELRYRKVLADELKSAGMARPPLEAAVIDGRTAVLYSPYDWSCSLEGDEPFACRGYVTSDGRKLALRIMLYAVSY